MDFFWFFTGIISLAICIFYIKQSWKNEED